MQNSNKLHIAIILAAAILSTGWIWRGNREGEQPEILETAGQSTRQSLATIENAHTKVMMANGGHILPFDMENIMADELVKLGVVDPNKLPELTELNLLWAFGLANKNVILEEGPIADPRYGGVQGMASVGGWTVARGGVMDHYSMHNLLELTPEQQSLVEDVSKNVYRPCCRNSTYFPDCNHGMAMLAFLEILAGQGATGEEMYTAARNANAIWFPDVPKTQGTCSV